MNHRSANFSQPASYSLSHPFLPCIGVKISPNMFSNTMSFPKVVATCCQEIFAVSGNKPTIRISWARLKQLLQRVASVASANLNQRERVSLTWRERVRICIVCCCCMAGCQTSCPIPFGADIGDICNHKYLHLH